MRLLENNALQLVKRGCEMRHGGIDRDNRIEVRHQCGRVGGISGVRHDRALQGAQSHDADQKLMRIPPKPPTGAAGLYERGLVALGACARDTDEVRENVP